MIVYGAVAPHPPMLIPEIGGRDLTQVEQTVAGMNRLAAEIVKRDPQILVVITPHGNVFRDAVSILGDPQLKATWRSLDRGSWNSGIPTALNSWNCCRARPQPITYRW